VIFYTHHLADSHIHFTAVPLPGRCVHIPKNSSANLSPEKPKGVNDQTLFAANLLGRISSERKNLKFVVTAIRCGMPRDLMGLNPFMLAVPWTRPG
jgi:hypothetical protein